MKSSLALDEQKLFGNSWLLVSQTKPGHGMTWLYSLKAHQDAMSDKCAPTVQVAGKAWPYGEALLLLSLPKAVLDAPQNRKRIYYSRRGLLTLLVIR